MSQTELVIHSLNWYTELPLSAGTQLSGDSGVNKTDTVLPRVELTFWWGRLTESSRVHVRKG